MTDDAKTCNCDSSYDAPDSFCAATSDPVPASPVSLAMQRLIDAVARNAELAASVVGACEPVLQPAATAVIEKGDERSNVPHVASLELIERSVSTTNGELVNMLERMML